VIFLALEDVLPQLYNLVAFIFKTSVGQDNIDRWIPILTRCKSLRALAIDAGGINAKNAEKLTDIYGAGKDRG
jgi:hypothetical protein